jgi:hypothetical protein
MNQRKMLMLALSIVVVLLFCVSDGFADNLGCNACGYQSTSDYFQTCSCECGTICDSCCNETCGDWFLFPQDEHAFNIHGWLDGGFIGNTSSPNSKFNGPYNAVDRSNEAMMNQLYLVAEAGLPSDGWGIGGRVDLLYGEDFFLAESIGIEKHPDG